MIVRATIPYGKHWQTIKNLLTKMTKLNVGVYFQTFIDIESIFLTFKETELKFCSN